MESNKGLLIIPYLCLVHCPNCLLFTPVLPILHLWVTGDLKPVIVQFLALPRFHFGIKPMMCDCDFLLLHRPAFLPSFETPAGRGPISYHSEYHPDHPRQIYH